MSIETKSPGSRRRTLAKDQAKLEDRVTTTAAQLVDTQDVCRLLRMSEDALEDLRKDTQMDFPQPIPGISKKKNLWRLRDIEAFVDRLEKERQKADRR